VGIRTVTGEISPSDCGITLPHEHLLFDLSSWCPLPTEATRIALAEAPVSIEILGELRRDASLSRDNVRQLDVELAIRELMHYRRAGGSTLVDVTSIGLGRDPMALRAISQATGVNVVMGCGYYFESPQLQYLRNQTIEQIQATIERDLVEGISNTGIRSGIIGEIGTSGPLTETEERVLRAAARAQLRTHAAISVHPDAFYQGREHTIRHILDILIEEGVPLNKVIICHIDDTGFNLDFQRSLMEQDAFVEYDSFGSEIYFDSMNAHEAHDSQRVDAVLKLAEEGFASHLLLSHDVCFKIHLKKYGGYGYDHILRHILPMMRRKGIREKDIDLMMVKNPATVLAT